MISGYKNESSCLRLGTGYSQTLGAVIQVVLQDTEVTFINWQYCGRYVRYVVNYEREIFWRTIISKQVALFDLLKWAKQMYSWARLHLNEVVRSIVYLPGGKL